MAQLKGGTRIYGNATVDGSLTTASPDKSTASTVVATTLSVKQLFASQSTAGTLDWNDVTNTRPGVSPTLLLGSATNGPGGGNYYHPLNIEYAGVSGTGNLTQLAISYGTPANDLRMRGRYQGAWSSWVTFLNSSNFTSFALSASTTSTQDGYFGNIALYDDSTPSHYLTITNSANLTAARTLSINTNDADRTISLSGNLTLANSLTTSGNFALTLTTTAATTATLPSGTVTLLATNGSGSSLTFGTGTLSLAGNFSTTGAFTVGLTATANTTLTLPTTGTLATLGNAETFTGVKTFTPTARTSGVASYFTVTTPADTGQTASTESIGVNFTAATRTWAAGALTLQRERVFAAPTYAFATASTLTTAINVDIATPTAGTNATITNAFALRAGRSKFTGAIECDGVITNGGFDFILGNFDQTNRGNSGASRALVKDANSTLVLNYAGDFGGGVQIQGSGVTITNNLVVSGNLVVNGTTTTVNSTTLTLDDPIITLGGDTAVAEVTKDRGVEFKWNGTTLTITNYIGNGTTTVTGTVASTVGFAAGDIITISGATGTEQTKLNGTWTIASIPDGTTFTFVVSSAVTAGTYTTTLGTTVKSKNGFFGLDQSTGRFTFIPQSNQSGEVYSGTLGDVQINALFAKGSTIDTDGLTLTNTSNTALPPYLTLHNKDTTALNALSSVGMILFRNDYTYSSYSLLQKIGGIQIADNTFSAKATIGFCKDTTNAGVYITPSGVDGVTTTSFIVRDTGNVGIGVSSDSPAQKLEVRGGIIARPTATQDGVIIAGRAGGTAGFAVTLTPTTLGASRTITLPDATGTVYVSSGTDVSLADGGTNASLTASNGGIVYSTATAMAILAGTATAGQILRSGASAAPSWSTATYPATTTINQILYSSAANTISGIGTANGGVLTTNASGVPSFVTGTTGQILVNKGTANPAYETFELSLHAPHASYKSICRVATTTDLEVSSFASDVLTGYDDTTTLALTTTAATTTISTTSTATLKVGAVVSTATVQVAAGTTVASITSATQFTVNNRANITTTAITGNGTTATATFAAQTYAPYAVGASIVISGAVPATYNGTFTVTGCTTTSVSWASTEITTATTQGTIAFTIAAGTSINTNFAQTIAALVIDGVTLAVNDRVLVKDSYTLGGLPVLDAAKYNGIYRVTATGSTTVPWTLTRTDDANIATDLDGAIVNVSEGTANFGKSYKTRFKGTDTLNTTEMYWGRLVDVNSSSYGITPVTKVGIDLSTDTETIRLKTATIADLVTGLSVGIKTIQAFAASTYTNASSVYIEGAPVQGTNATITNAYALQVATGNTFLGGNLIVGNVDSSGTAALNIGTGANAKTITMGNGTGATSVVINCGTGALNIGTNAIARTITIGNQTGASALTLDSGTGAINIGTAIAKTITIGNTTGATGVVINAGTAGVTLPSGLTKVGTSTLTQGSATARTITFPDATTTLVGTDATQTLSNKTYLIPYTEGAGTALTATAETTNQPLFPAAGDTITLAVGVYEISMVLRVTRGATSTTASALRFNILGTGTAVGTFSGVSIGSVSDGGAATIFNASAVNINTNNTATTTSITVSGVYNLQVTGIIKITTAGTIIPAYGLTVALAGATTTTTCSASNYMRIVPISTSGTTTAQGGWA
jgi:hypothetical protein